MRRIIYVVPILVVVVLGVFLVRRLSMMEEGHTPNLIPSAMINKPMPDFSLKSAVMHSPDLRSSDLRGHVVLVNIFASWCPECRSEHSVLKKAKTEGIDLVGITYKDWPAAVQAWLMREGNPYQAVGVDADGRTAIDFGTYGVPETYLIDKQGIIRYKQIGPMTQLDFLEKILPLAKELNK